MSHFNVELDNPVTILQQEEAKVFFQEMNEQQLYDFFYRATLLKTTQELYQDANTGFFIAKEHLEKKGSDLTKKRRNVEEWARKLATAERIETEGARSKEYIAEFKWLKVKQKEEEKAKISAKVQDQEDTVKSMNAQAKEAEREIEKSEILLETVSTEHANSREKNELAQSQAKAAKKAYVQASSEAKEVRNALETKEEDLKEKVTQKKILENEAREKKVARKALQKERALKMAGLESNRETLVQRSEALQKEMGMLGQKRDALADEVRQARDELNAMRSEQDRQLQERSEAQREQARLEKAGNSKEAQHLARFGVSIMALATQVERAWPQGRFRRKPVGPVGRHVKLIGKAAEVGSELPDLLEAELGGRALTAFLAHCHEDRKELEALIRDIFRRSRPPMISVMRLGGGRCDISRGRVSTSPEMPGILDYLSFDDDDAFNFLVEETRAEKTLVVSQEQAQVRTMSTHLHIQC